MAARMARQRRARVFPFRRNAANAYVMDSCFSCWRSPSPYCPPEVSVKRSFLFPLFLLILPFVQACDNSFSPKAEYEDRVVVFCVLDRAAPFQIVRLEKTYDAELTNPDKPIGKTSIDSAVVIVRTDDGTFRFKDTLLTQADGSKKKVWINRNLAPREGKLYTVTVDVPGFPRLSGNTLVPSRAYLQVSGGETGVRLSTVTSVAFPATAYLFRLWVVGTKNNGGSPVEFRREVPARYNSDTKQYEFGSPSRRTVELIPLDNLMYAQTQLRDIDGVIGQDVVITAYGMDQYLYSYFQLVRGFDDPTSYRLDRPDVSNITNGAGIFGSMFPDSLRVRYNSLVR